MKIDHNSARDSLHAYQVAQAQMTKQREFDYQQHLERKKHDLKVQETRTERAKRLDLNKGRNVDVDC
jgi:hypothetical protein